MGRRRTVINRETFIGLCRLQCTLKEIASFFECSEDTIERWCVRELGKKFAEAYEEHSAAGKISLRRLQFKLAEKSAAMAIFLGKQYLGQRDQQDIQISASDDDTVKAMDEYFAKKAAGAKH